MFTKIYRYLVILLGLFGLFGCVTGVKSNNSTTATIKSNNSTTATIKSKEVITWIVPTKSVCKSNGGYYTSKENSRKNGSDPGCTATWRISKNICNELGGFLPEIKLLEQIVTNCGGIVHRQTDSSRKSSKALEKNIKNESYRECTYKKRGSYWSSTTHSRYPKSAFFMDFESGGIDDMNKLETPYVQCGKKGLRKSKTPLKTDLKEGKKYYDLGAIKEKHRDYGYPYEEVELYKKSCDLNYGLGCAALGRIKMFRDNFDSDAGKILKKAYRLNPISVYINLGYAYEEGRGGLNQNYDKAGKLYQKACDANIGMGCHNIAQFYESKRKGVTMDINKAYKLHKKACNLQYKDSCYRVKKLLQKLY